MIKLEKALAGLGLKQSFFDELKADLEAERIITENGLLPITKEDVKDELKQLDTEVDTDPIDEDDENQIDMDAISPSMRKLYE
jgi:regulator of replication initiation timing